jgi:hypothetical protein
MSDDLLDALARSLREDLEAPAGEEDDPWLAPFEGDERANLLDAALARIEAGESVEPLAALEALDASLDAAQEAPDAPKAPDAQEAPEAPSAEASSSGAATVIDLRSRRRFGVGIGVGIGVALAAAAAVALVWFGVSGLGGPGREATVAMLPSYSTSELRGGLAAQRGDVEAPETELELSVDDRIDWVLTPAEPVREALDVALLARPETAAGEAVYRRDVAAELSPAGAVRLRGQLDTFIELSPGRWSLTLLIAPAGALPSDAAEANSEAGGWQRATIRVTIRGAP